VSWSGTRSRILVDSSVWIANFRDPTASLADRLRTLIDDDLVAVAGAIVYEVLQGTRTSQEFEAIRQIFLPLRWLPAQPASWVAAAGMAAGLRRRGLSFPMTDILLATLAREHRCHIWSLDPHFTLIPGVRLFSPPKVRPGPRRPRR